MAIDASCEGAIQNRRTSSVIARTATIAVAAALPLFAILTWDQGSGISRSTAAFRFFSIPVVLIEILVIGLAAISGRKLVRTIGHLPKWCLPAAIILLLVMSVTAFSVENDKAITVVMTISWVIHLIFSLSVYTIYLGINSEYYKIWQYIVSGILIYILILAIFVITIPDETTFNWLFLKLAVSNVRHLGLYATVGMSAALGLAISAENNRNRTLAILAGAVLAALAFWSGTRSSALAVFGALIVCAVIIPRFRIFRSAAMISVMLLGGLALATIDTRPHPAYGWQRLFKPTTAVKGDRVTSGRIDMWRETAVQAMERPFFGHGESQFRTQARASQGFYNQPHNSVIQMLFQWGIVGSACFFALLATAWFAMCRKVRAFPLDHLPAFLTVNALLLLSLIDAALYYPYPVMMLFFALATTLAAPARRDDPAG